MTLNGKECVSVDKKDPLYQKMYRCARGAFQRRFVNHIAVLGYVIEYKIIGGPWATKNHYSPRNVVKRINKAIETYGFKVEFTEVGQLNAFGYRLVSVA